MKYKVGDKIRIVKKSKDWCDDGDMDHMLGKVVTIAHIDEECDPGIGVKDNKAVGVSQYDCWWFNEDEVELVE